jgi:hypothetical protein
MNALGIALFVGAIASSFIDVDKANAIGIDERIKYQGIARAYDPPAVPCYVAGSPWQSVMVSRPSPNIEKLSSGLDVQDILGGECGTRHMWGSSSSANHFWPKHSGAGRYRSAHIVEIERIGDGNVSEEAIRIELQSSRGGVPAVLPDWPYSPIKVPSRYVRFVKWGNSVGKHERSFIGNESFSSQAPLSGSGSPERRRESCDDDGGKCSDSPIVLVNELTRTFGISSDRSKESGWVFFGGIVLVVCLVLGDAFFEVWRKKSLTRNKRRQKNN